MLFIIIIIMKTTWSSLAKNIYVVVFEIHIEFTGLTKT